MSRGIGHITGKPLPDAAEYTFNSGTGTWEPKTAKHKRRCKARRARNRVARASRKINRRQP